MYPNLRAEMARKNVTITDLATELKLRIGTVSIKLRKGKVSLKEAKQIKQFLGVEMPLDELFTEEEV